MEEELFKLCKAKEEDEKVSVGVLLHVSFVGAKEVLIITKPNV